MRFSDDWLKNGLPVFSGGKDRTVARKMIDTLGGPAGFKTAKRTNPDGSVTTVQLKGNMPPQVYTTAAPTIAPLSEIRLLCRLLSDLYPAGVQRTTSATVNANYSWPGYPVSNGKLPTTNNYDGVYSTTYSDSQGGSTWYDSRAVGAQFSHVLSWSSVAYDGQCGIGQGYDGFLPYAITYTAHTYQTPGGSNITKALGMYFPGQIVGETGHYRYTQTPSAPTRLYRNGVDTLVSGYLLGACSVMIDGVEHYRTVEQYNYNQGSDRYALCLRTFSIDAVLLSTVNVILPESVVTVTNIAHSFRWNSSGTQAAGALAYTDSGGTTRYDILQFGLDGVASIVPCGAPSGRLRTAVKDSTPTYISTWTSHAYDDKYTYQTIVAVDYVGDTLVWLRHQQENTNYSSGLVTVTKNAYNHVTDVSIQTQFGTRRSDSLVLEPSGTQLYFNEYDSSGVTAYSETWVWSQDPLYPLNPAMQVRTGISSSDGSSSSTQPWRFLAGVCCDLRTAAIFVVESVETAIGLWDYIYSAAGAGARTLSRTSNRTQGIQGLECKLVANGVTTALGAVANAMIYRDAVDPVTTQLGDSWPYLSTSDLITANTMTTGWTGAHSSDGPNILSLQGKLSKSGNVGVFSLAHTDAWPTSWSGITTAHFGAINKVVRKTGGVYVAADLALPTYDGAFKWLVEPLLLETP